LLTERSTGMAARPFCGTAVSVEVDMMRCAFGGRHPPLEGEGRSASFGAPVGVG
jgi:hypothetical protein